MPEKKILNMEDMPDKNRREEAEKVALIYLIALQAKELKVGQEQYDEFMKIFHKAPGIKAKLGCFETEQAKLAGFKKPSSQELKSETIKFYHSVSDL